MVLPFPLESYPTILDIFLFSPFIRREVDVEGLRFVRVPLDGDNHCVFKINRVVSKTPEFLPVCLAQRGLRVLLEEAVLFCSKSLQLFFSLLQWIFYDLLRREIPSTPQKKKTQ